MAGRPDATFSSDDLILGIWNNDTGDWEQIDSTTASSGSFGNMSETITMDFGDYVDNDGHLTLILFNEDEDNVGGTDGPILTDVVGVTVSAPGGTAVDTITDFTPGAGGDVLDIDALLPGSVTGATTVSEIDNYLDFTYDDPTQTTTMHVDPDGAGAGGVSQEIKIEGVDLTDGGANSDQDIITNLIADGNLVV